MEEAPELDNQYKISKFNSAIYQLYRIHRLWVNIHKAVQQKKYEAWNTLLDRIWSELSRDLTERQYEQWLAKIKDIDKKIVEKGAFIDSPPEGWKDVSEEIVKNRIEQYHLLMDKEQELRRLENILGKGTSWRDEIEDDID